MPPRFRYERRTRSTYGFSTRRLLTSVLRHHSYAGLLQSNFIKGDDERRRTGYLNRETVRIDAHGLNEILDERPTFTVGGTIPYTLHVESGQ